MHDTLQYFALDPVFRKYHHSNLTFRMLYAFTENFALPLSHDEVVHGKSSLVGKMSGDDWQKFANLRLLLAWQFAQPGKKLLFMGAELGQWSEWNHDASLDWHLLAHDRHSGIQRWVQDLNRVYRAERALHELDFQHDGFEWVDCHDTDQSTITVLRRGSRPQDVVLATLNFTPVPRPNFRVGVPCGGFWRELLNSDATVYGGSGWGNAGGVEATAAEMHGRPHSLTLVLPPLAAVFLKPEGDGK